MSDEEKRPCSRCGRFSKYLNKEGLCVGCIRGFGGNYTKEVKATGIELDTKPMKFEQYEIPKKIKV